MIGATTVYSLVHTKAELAQLSPTVKFVCDWCKSSIAADADSEVWVGTTLGKEIIGHARCAGVDRDGRELKP